MLNGGSRKKGFTLVEVLVVIVIMGVLSSMGVVAIQNAVAHSRVKGYAQNAAAFLEGVALDANRMSKPICLKVTEYTLEAYDTSCKLVENDDSPYASYTFVEEFTKLAKAPAKFGCDIDDDIQSQEGMVDSDNWAKADTVSFIPRIGLSSAPNKGFVCVQYGSGDDAAYGIAIKYHDKNMISAKWIPKWESGEVWNEL